MDAPLDWLLQSEPWVAYRTRRDLLGEAGSLGNLAAILVGIAYGTFGEGNMRHVDFRQPGAAVYQRMLRDERAQLLRKNEDARSKVEAMIVRLRSLEQES